MGRYSFPRVLGELSETLWTLFVSTNSHTRKLGEVLVFRAVLVGILVGTLVRILNEIFVETFITDLAWLAILDIAGILSGILVEYLLKFLLAG